MTAAWMLYGLGTSALCALAAWALEHALRSRGIGLRWAWVAGVTGALALPLGVLIAGHLSSGTARDPGQTSLVDVVVFQFPLAAIGGVPPASPDREAALLMLWALASAVVVALVAYSHVDLARQRRRWRHEEIDGAQLWVSRDVGPAVVGFMRGEIVLPEWAFRTEPRARAIMLRHEQEHVAARDPLLAGLSLMALVLAPWNPPLWWMHRRLRQAIEMDCDRRVLRHLPDVREYGTILLRVAQRSSRPWVAAAAFSQTSSHLGRRIRHMLDAPRQGSWSHAFGFAALALVVIAVACEVPGPASPRAGVTEPAPADDELAQRAGTTPPAQSAAVPPGVFTPGELDRRPEVQNRDALPELLQAAYPPALLAAGAEGESVVAFVITEAGDVDPTTIRIVSTTHPEFAEAAAKAVPQFHFTPGQLAGVDVPTIVQVPLVWKRWR